MTCNTHTILLERRLKTRSRQFIYSYQTFSHNHDSDLFLEGQIEFFPVQLPLFIILPYKLFVHS